MKAKTIFKKIPVTPYVVDLWIVITNEPSKEVWRMNKKNRGLDLSWDEGAAAQTEGSLYNNHILVTIFDATLPYDINTICHESVHIVNIVFEHAGIPISTDNDEPFAYLTGWVAEQISKAWQEFKRS